MNKMRKYLLVLVAVMSAFTVWGNHPWLTRVYEYRPAPGQFVNTMPVARIGEPLDSVLARCCASICGRVDTISQPYHGQIITRIDTVWAESMISLGGYGGYVIVGFDHPVVNSHGYDFEIFGNAFVSDRESHGGSSEPGIVINATNFPDPQFRSYLLKRDFGKDGQITSSEITAVKEINSQFNK